MDFSQCIEFRYSGKILTTVEPFERRFVNAFVNMEFIDYTFHLLGVMLLLVLVEGCGSLCDKRDHCLCDFSQSIHNDCGVPLIGSFNVHLLVCAKPCKGFSFFC